MASILDLAAVRAVPVAAVTVASIRFDYVRIATVTKVGRSGR